MNRDHWEVIGLFAAGIAMFSGGYALVLDAGLGHLSGVGLTLAGGAVIGGAWVVDFRRRAGSVSRRRTVTLVATFTSVGVGSVAITPFLGTGDVANLGFLVFFIPALTYWINKIKTETKVNQTDERMQLLAYQAAFWMLVVIVVLAGVLLWAELFGMAIPSAKTILTAIIGIGLFGWYGTFRYLQTHN